EGMPALAKKKVVVDLSTQRTMARASFHTVTPSSRKACNTPRYMVTCSKLPPATNKTSAPRGQWSPRPGMARPVRVLDEKPQAVRGTVSGLMTRAQSALATRRPCHFFRSQNRMTSDAMASAEGAGEDRVVDASGLEALAGFERRHRNHGRAEQHEVDGVEIALHRLEDFGERLAVILRL